MKKQLPAWAVLTIIAGLAGILLGLTNEITASQIKEQAVIATNAARRAVLPAAEEFEEQDLEEGAAVDNCYLGLAGGRQVGYTSQITVKGYGGEIEITVGMDDSGTITGISVGGANFSETVGLGSKTKDPAFTGQFQGLTPPAAIGENVDAITSATISSGAVVSGVNKAADYMGGLLFGAAEGDSAAGVLPGATNLQEQTPPAGVDGYWTAGQGSVVQVTVQGFGGPIEVKVGILADGTVAGLEIGGSGFAETPGLGERVVEEEFWGQFVGQSGPFEVGGNIDAVSGATISSSAVAKAVNAALSAIGG